MNKQEALTQLEIMATNATGRLGEAKSEEEKALLSKEIEALNMGITAINLRNSLIIIPSGTVEEPKDTQGHSMKKEMEALIEDINPKEIASHIETDTLGDWCEILRHELIRTLNKMEKSEEPKTGHWIGIEYDGYADGYPVYDVYECSECGMEYDATDDGEITHNYCPNCGAKMERETNE